MGDRNKFSSQPSVMVTHFRHKLPVDESRQVKRSLNLLSTRTCNATEIASSLPCSLTSELFTPFIESETMAPF